MRKFLCLVTLSVVAFAASAEAAGTLDRAGRPESFAIEELRSPLTDQSSDCRLVIQRHDVAFEVCRFELRFAALDVSRFVPQGDCLISKSAATASRPAISCRAQCFADPPRKHGRSY